MSTSRLRRLIRERRECYTAREQVQSVASKLKLSIDQLSPVYAKVKDWYAIDGMGADAFYLRNLKAEEEVTLNKIYERVLPDIDDEIERLSREIEEEMEDDEDE